jgi:hypothetical protein
MKVKFCIICLLLAFEWTAHAFREGVALVEPRVVFSDAFPKAARTNVLAALRRTDSKYLDGRLLNSFTSLSYAGDTKDLNSFLGGLARCPGVTLSIGFASEHLPPNGGDWHVQHEGYTNRFRVWVNLKSSHLNLDELVLPEVNGPEILARPMTVPAPPEHRRGDPVPSPPKLMLEYELLRTPPHNYGRTTLWLYVKPQREEISVTARCHIGKTGEDLGRFPLQRLEKENGRVLSVKDDGRILFMAECLAEEFIKESFIYLTVKDERSGEVLPGMKVPLKDAVIWQGP